MITIPVSAIVLATRKRAVTRSLNQMKAIAVATNGRAA